ncbi:hypothetical protein PVAND_000714 [Polypedilum vanderplanki]|uniref:tRNA (guanine-N(7)-)-methyltransferase non-catalytic subunit wuho n=1 Tax=Polypedilum vanderplanki TaxID=319348 RepID=A0A9J6BL08_POLVA|nr:hypothetical protein PVAND_000714 [Polypedilum vanderplanki]
MESFKNFLIFSPDYQKLIAFVSTEDQTQNFTIEVDWNYPINNIKPKLFLENQENADNDDEGKKQNGSEEKISLNNIAVTEENNLLAYTATDKTLFLWQIDEKSAKIVSRRSFLRTSSCIRFSKCGKILFLTDKTGDVFEYLCDEENFNTRGRWIFGHISQILDLAVTIDLKYLITSDRDEKIRVTNYPKVHEINSYCMGHKEFVSAIAIISDSHLISISGDKCIKLWNFIDGKELQSHSFQFVPVLLKVISHSHQTGLLCVSSIENTVYIFKYLIIDDTMTLDTLAEKQFKSDVELAVLNNEFYIEYIRDNDDSLKSGIFIDRVKIEDKTVNFQKIFDNIALSETDISIKIVKPFDVSLLFKHGRMFDNVKEYNDRKKARIENKMKSKKAK